MIYILHKKIELEIIPHRFEEIDLEYALDEVLEIASIGKPQIEKLTQELLHFFIEHPSNDPYKYILTSHATRFIDFLGNKLFNEHKHFPLRKTFQNYGLFKAKKVNDITDFKVWYENNFKNSSRALIENHLEAFKDVINESIIRLNKIISSPDNIAFQNLDEFTKLFRDSISRSKEINETLQLSGNLKGQIRIVVEYFDNKVTSVDHILVKKDPQVLEILKEDYDTALRIKSEVFNFFDVIKEKLDQIIDRYIYADKQLANFKENFRTRTQFQRNLRKFLEANLQAAVYDRNEGIRFFKPLKLKSVPEESFKYLNVKRYDSFIKKKSFVLEEEIDPLYALEQMKSASIALDKQEEVARQLNILKINLSKQIDTDLTKEFYRLLKETNDEKVSLKVVFDILKYVSKHKEYDLKIKQDIPEKYQNENILIWQMNIMQKQ
ncbi:hypothetical protein [Croceibacter atlanticus]|uniref:hypothetical protein n=1 Tax=Croceibacter atlanticus TaxID=313588 RepID=UPI002492BB3F|nr:hypothetical protein [Croceibacter atlanticus]